LRLLAAIPISAFRLLLSVSSVASCSPCLIPVNPRRAILSAVLSAVALAKAEGQAKAEGPAKADASICGQTHFLCSAIPENCAFLAKLAERHSGQVLK
jgi:hypothetical protein